MEDLGIKNIRIDERLIHGQVATMWTNSLKASRIMVVGDDVVHDSIQKMALKTAVPAGVKLSILKAQSAAEKILSGKYKGQRVFMLVKSPKWLRILVDNGLPIEKVNVGNMSSREGSKQVKKSVAVTQTDIDDFNYLNDHGIELIAQMVPSEDPVKFMKLLEDR
ncbi:PTS sugar transporter subunit IIB [Lactobacillus halodurans]|uniref:PTS sugar transporter subunit IIB n=1 Tax=Companilactobacillus halodurans TaxID=2584183 RepID=A0A5P0ZX57_9LACO|nr:PTS sugar transporter subunit IIB [Companilactobacillus halodurans]MQS97590.1 PTS sugar transporter subunit IIB [Companilactobacillus halodurans]